MSDFLAEMAVSSRLRAEEAKRGIGVAGLSARAESAPPALALELSRDGFDLIAEAKLASPSEGRLTSGPRRAGTAARLAEALAASGPAALSVLTEPTYFDGGLDHLEEVVSTVEIPVMRKDFIVDPVQVLEARVSGASGVLLIARMTESPLLVEMTDLALGLGMFTLIELFDEDDLDVASAVFDRDVLVGVNARDLLTLEVNETRHAGMVSSLPPHLPWVAESGITTPAETAMVARLGYRLALVGTTLTRATDPSALAGELLRAGREAVIMMEHT